MRQAARSFRWIITGIAVAMLAGCAYSVSASRSPQPPRSDSTPDTTAPIPSTAPTTTAPTTTAPPTTLPPVEVLPVVAYATGNAQLDALLPTLPPLLADGAATVRFGYNPLDTCCHAGGYNPEPNEVWIGDRAFSSAAKLTYVTVHELAHSLHIKTARGTALTAAVAGAPTVRAGSAWDDSEKVADCIAWVLYPAETAASGITYWSCPDPWRSQVRAALQ